MGSWTVTRTALFGGRLLLSRYDFPSLSDAVGYLLDCGIPLTEDFVDHATLHFDAQVRRPEYVSWQFDGSARWSVVEYDLRKTDKDMIDPHMP